ncbi:hypothetical protein L0663_05170 [Dyadobacter sp. CY107]|uniref:hypothetical protein n=1 Tax=Dyadobacter fanqingshengii TaxID=2906443 RepID=UPI001F21ED95|nr:hypothetical protein [Dyadobacter fanqingshengii]MCF2502758.1 hypothetical protein [Dyadobacter fanqingshengii]
MTDQSKPTTDMPDVIYYFKSNYGETVFSKDDRLRNSSVTKYIRADLVTAAPTGDKAAAFNPAVKENWSYHDEYEFWYMAYPGTDLEGEEKGVRARGLEPWNNCAALQQDDSDLVKALEFYASEENWEPTEPSSPEDDNGGELALVDCGDIARQALAAHNAKTEEGG